MDKLYKKIDKYLDEGEYEKAISLFESSSEVEKTAEVKALVAVAYNNLDTNEALRTAVGLLLSVANQVKDKFRLYYRLGFSYYHLEQIDEAIDAFLKSKKEYESNPTEDRKNIYGDVLYFLHNLKIYQMEIGTAPTVGDDGKFDDEFPLVGAMYQLDEEYKEYADKIVEEFEEFIEDLEDGEDDPDEIRESIDDLIFHIHEIIADCVEEDSEVEEVVMSSTVNNIRYILEYFGIDVDFGDDEDSESDDQKYDPKMYEEDEMEVVEAYIAENFGKYSNVFHELVSPDIHVDLCVIDPTPERDFYTIVTMGMGAHKMNAPSELENRDRAELCIYLPSDWQLNEQEESWYWPLRWLKILARLPIENDTWLGHLHTIPCGRPLAENTDLAGFILEAPDTMYEDIEVCTLPNGEVVNFYAIIPLHDSEMTYKVENGGESLMELLEDQTDDIYVVDIDREQCVDDSSDDKGLIDLAQIHIDKIYEKQLPVDILSAYNHLAAYLRWFIEKDMLFEDFYKVYPEVVELVKNKDSNFDLRVFLHENFNGHLSLFLLNDEGVDFSLFYYDDANITYYPDDVDSYAIDVFGEDKEEMQNEEYLFLLWNEEYYQGIKKYIDAAYEEFLEL